MPKTLLVLLLSLYICSFWGQAARVLPAPLDQWYHIYYRLLADLWHQSTATLVPPRESRMVFQALEAYLLGFLVPLAALRATGRSGADCGLRKPRAGSAWLTLALALPALGCGVFLAWTVEDPWHSPLYEALELAAMLPEHFLIFGVLTAMALPGRSLHREPRVMAGSRERSGPGAELRLGLTDRELSAVAVSAIVFQLVHFGAPQVEVFLSLAMGFAFAYVTLLTASIWPALLAHWALNLLPMAWMAMYSAPTQI